MTSPRNVTIGFAIQPEGLNASASQMVLNTSLATDPEVRDAFSKACAHWVRTRASGERAWRDSDNILDARSMVISGSLAKRSLHTSLRKHGLEFNSLQFGELNSDITIAQDMVLANEAVMDNTFVVSITAETWDQAALEAGETDQREMIVDAEVFDNDDLRSAARKYGTTEIAAAPANYPSLISFRSAQPSEDRAHFEKGEDTSYQLHVHEVNGETPTPEVCALVARLIGANVSAGHANSEFEDDTRVQRPASRG